MKKRIVGGWACVIAVAVVAETSGQVTTTTETGADGVTYRVTRQIVQQSIPTTEYQTQQQKVYRPQVTTQYQSYSQNYYTPVTEYQWVPRLKGQWNPFVTPYWAHELRPVTRWETRTGTVQVPTTRTDWVEETRTAQVPVTTYRTAQAEHVSRVPVGVSGAGSGQTSVALRPVDSQYGGQKMQSDPPRSSTSYR